MQAKSTHTLEQTAILLGWSTHTVRIYAGIAGIVPAAGPHYRQRRLYSDADIELLRRTRAERDPQYLSAKASDSGDLAARVATLETTIERLQQRWPHLFAETRHSAPQVPAVELPVYEPPRRLTPSTASHTTHSAREPIPAGWVHQNQWAEDHHMSSTTVKRHIKDEDIPLEHGDWIEGTTPVKHLLAEEGQAQLHRHFRLGDPCTVCGWSSSQINETTPTHAVVEVARPEIVGK